MPFKSFIATAIVLMTISGCTTGAANNTDYARPPEAGGGVRIPIN